MLVLTMKLGEQLIIEGDGKTVITVEEVRGNRTKLTFSAPEKVKIYREKQNEHGGPNDKP